MATNPLPQAPWGEYIPRVGRMTVEQFEQFPSEDGWMYELHQGRLIIMPGPGFDHAAIQAAIFRIIDRFLQTNKLGILIGTGCYNLPLPGNTEEVLCPDLSFIISTKLATMQKRGSYLVGAPDLVIEITSPSDTHPEMALKATTYLQAGVQLIWILWPTSKTIDVWMPQSSNKIVTVLKIGDTLDGLDVIPGFQCPVKDVFDI
jgi:Uma2 family endonuclease